MATRGLPTWPHLGESPEALPDAERLILDAARAWAGRGPAGPLGEAALILASQSADGMAPLLERCCARCPACIPAARSAR